MIMTIEVVRLSNTADIKNVITAINASSFFFFFVVI